MKKFGKIYTLLQTEFILYSACVFDVTVKTKGEVVCS